ncbi:hypothetical protein [Dactylosporangium sp. NPDC050588]
MRTLPTARHPLGHWIWAPALDERLEHEHLLPEPSFAGHTLR